MEEEEEGTVTPFRMESPNLISIGAIGNDRPILEALEARVWLWPHSASTLWERRGWETGSPRARVAQINTRGEHSLPSWSEVES